MDNFDGFEIDDIMTPGVDCFDVPSSSTVVSDETVGNEKEPQSERRSSRRSAPTKSYSLLLKHGLTFDSPDQKTSQLMSNLSSAPPTISNYVKKSPSKTVPKKFASINEANSPPIEHKISGSLKVESGSRNENLTPPLNRRMERMDKAPRRKSKSKSTKLKDKRDKSKFESQSQDSFLGKGESEEENIGHYSGSATSPENGNIPNLNDEITEENAAEHARRWVSLQETFESERADKLAFLPQPGESLLSFVLRSQVAAYGAAVPEFEAFLKQAGTGLENSGKVKKSEQGISDSVRKKLQSSRPVESREKRYSRRTKGDQTSVGNGISEDAEDSNRDELVKNSLQETEPESVEGVLSTELKTQPKRKIDRTLTPLPAELPEVLLESEVEEREKETEHGPEHVVTSKSGEILDKLENVEDEANLKHSPASLIIEEMDDDKSSQNNEIPGEHQKVVTQTLSPDSQHELFPDPGSDLTEVTTTQESQIEISNRLMALTLSILEKKAPDRVSLKLYPEEDSDKTGQTKGGAESKNKVEIDRPRSRSAKQNDKTAFENAERTGFLRKGERPNSRSKVRKRSRSSTSLADVKVTESTGKGPKGRMRSEQERSLESPKGPESAENHKVSKIVRKSNEGVSTVSRRKFEYSASGRGKERMELGKYRNSKTSPAKTAAAKRKRALENIVKSVRQNSASIKRAMSELVTPQAMELSPEKPDLAERRKANSSNSDEKLKNAKNEDVDLYNSVEIGEFQVTDESEYEFEFEIATSEVEPEEAEISASKDVGMRKVGKPDESAKESQKDMSTSGNKLEKKSQNVSFEEPQETEDSSGAKTGRESVKPDEIPENAENEESNLRRSSRATASATKRRLSNILKFDHLGLKRSLAALERQETPDLQPENPETDSGGQSRPDAREKVSNLLNLFDLSDAGLSLGTMGPNEDYHMTPECFTKAYTQFLLLAALPVDQDAILASCQRTVSGDEIARKTKGTEKPKCRVRARPVAAGAQPSPEKQEPVSKAETEKIPESSPDKSGMVVAVSPVKRSPGRPRKYTYEERPPVYVKKAERVKPAPVKRRRTAKRLTVRRPKPAVRGPATRRRKAVASEPQENEVSTDMYDLDYFALRRNLMAKKQGAGAPRTLTTRPCKVCGSPVTSTRVETLCRQCKVTYERYKEKPQDFDDIECEKEANCPMDESVCAQCYVWHVIHRVELVQAGIEPPPPPPGKAGADSETLSPEEGGPRVKNVCRDMYRYSGLPRATFEDERLLTQPDSTPSQPNGPRLSALSTAEKRRIVNVSEPQDTPLPIGANVTRRSRKTVRFQDDTELTPSLPPSGRKRPRTSLGHPHGQEPQPGRSARKSAGVLVKNGQKVTPIESPFNRRPGQRSPSPVVLHEDGRDLRPNWGRKLHGMEMEKRRRRQAEGKGREGVPKGEKLAKRQQQVKKYRGRGRPPSPESGPTYARAPRRRMVRPPMPRLAEGEEWLSTDDVTDDNSRSIDDGEELWRGRISRNKHRDLEENTEGNGKNAGFLEHSDQPGPSEGKTGEFSEMESIFDKFAVSCTKQRAASAVKSVVAAGKVQKQPSVVLERVDRSPDGKKLSFPESSGKETSFQRNVRFADDLQGPFSDGEDSFYSESAESDFSDQEDSLGPPQYASRKGPMPEMSRKMVPKIPPNMVPKKSPYMGRGHLIPPALQMMREKEVRCVKGTVRKNLPRVLAEKYGKKAARRSAGRVDKKRRRPFGKRKNKGGLADVKKGGALGKRFKINNPKYLDKDFVNPEMEDSDTTERSFSESDEEKAETPKTEGFSRQKQEGSQGFLDEDCEDELSEKEETWKPPKIKVHYVKKTLDKAGTSKGEILDSYSDTDDVSEKSEFSDNSDFEDEGRYGIKMQEKGRINQKPAERRGGFATKVGFERNFNGKSANRFQKKSGYQQRVNWFRLKPPPLMKGGVPVKMGKLMGRDEESLDKYRKVRRSASENDNLNQSPGEPSEPMRHSSEKLRNFATKSGHPPQIGHFPLDDGDSGERRTSPASGRSGIFSRPQETERDAKMCQSLLEGGNPFSDNEEAESLARPVSAQRVPQVAFSWSKMNEIRRKYAAKDQGPDGGADLDSATVSDDQNSRDSELNGAGNWRKKAAEEMDLQDGFRQRAGQSKFPKSPVDDEDEVYFDDDLPPPVKLRKSESLLATNRFLPGNSRLRDIPGTSRDFDQYEDDFDSDSFESGSDSDDSWSDDDDYDMSARSKAMAGTSKGMTLAGYALQKRAMKNSFKQKVEQRNLRKEQIPSDPDDEPSATGGRGRQADEEEYSFGSERRKRTRGAPRQQADEEEYSFGSERLKRTRGAPRQQADEEEDSFGSERRKRTRGAPRQQADEEEYSFDPERRKRTRGAPRQQADEEEHSFGPEQRKQILGAARQQADEEEYSLGHERRKRTRGAPRQQADEEEYSLGPERRKRTRGAPRQQADEEEYSFGPEKRKRKPKSPTPEPEVPEKAVNWNYRFPCPMARPCLMDKQKVEEAKKAQSEQKKSAKKPRPPRKRKVKTEDKQMKISEIPEEQQSEDSAEDEL